jgi:hypothetical protein
MCYAKNYVGKVVATFKKQSNTKNIGCKTVVFNNWDDFKNSIGLGEEKDIKTNWRFHDIDSTGIYYINDVELRTDKNEQ